MIFQNPRTALNPIRPVGKQIADVLIRHGNVPRREAPAQRRRNAARGRHHRSGAPRQGLSVRNVRRHVPARDDRDRACRQAVAADRRRADHRPRRDDAGRDHGSGQRSRQGTRHGDDLHHPRSGARRPALRAHRRHACRPCGRECADQGIVRQSAPSLYGGADRGDAGFGGEASTSSRRFPARCPICAAPTCRRAAIPSAARASLPPARSRCRSRRPAPRISSPAGIRCPSKRSARRK